jgi:hypothetical protein
MKFDFRIGPRFFALAPIVLMTLTAAGCAPMQPPPPTPQVLACASPRIVEPAPQPPSASETLLRYQQSLLAMSRDELQREANSFATQPDSPHAMLQKSMALALLRGAGDLARAQQLSETVLRSNDERAGPLKPLAQMLAANQGELRRQGEQTDKLAQQVREQQRRIDQLDHMLEGLKAIERNLSVRPGAAVVPSVPAK